MLLRRYIVIEVARFFGAIAVGLIVLLVTIQLATLLGDAAEGKLAAGDIVRMALYKVGARSPEILPLALYLGIFTALARLQRDNEIVVMWVAGFQFRHGVIAMLMLAVLVGLAGAGLALFAKPELERGFRDTKHDSERRATILGIQAGRFQELGDQDQVVYAERLASDATTIEHTFLQFRTPDGARVIRSRQALIERDGDAGRYAVLVDGSSYQGWPGRPDYTVTDFGRYGFLLDDTRAAIEWQGTKFLGASELFIDPALEQLAELNARLAFPLATVVLAGLAIALAPLGYRKQFHIQLISAIAIYFVYTNVLIVANGLMRTGKTPAWLGSWWVHVPVLLALTLLLSWRGARRRLS